MLSKVKAMLGIDGFDYSRDGQLAAVIDAAEAEAREFCNLDDDAELSDGLKSAVVQMAVIKYNRLGTEGLASESYAGASYSYTDGYPESILRTLRRNRRMRAV